MKVRKSKITLVALALALALSGNALAGGTPATIVLTQPGDSSLWASCYNSSGQLIGYGGEFNAVLSSGSTFTTFCLEQTVDFYPGVTYDYTASESLGGQSLPIGAPFLSAGAAWLYSQFAATPSTYTANNTAITEFQDAIWELEGESVYQPGSGLLYTPTSNGDYNAAVAALGGSSAALAENSSGDVYAAVLTIPDTNPIQYAQNQLIVIPGDEVDKSTSVPDSGMSVMLLGMALGGVAFARRKFRA